MATCRHCSKEFQQTPAQVKHFDFRCRPCENARFARSSRKAPARVDLGHNLTPHQNSIFNRSMPIPEAGCWLWVGNVGSKGYGRHSLGRAGLYADAHRSSYVAFRGPIPTGLFVCHKCDTPSCVNPDHLFVGTHADNMQDMLRKGRNPRWRPRVGGRCGNGHAMEGENVRMWRGKKQCRACNAAAVLRYRARKSAALATAGGA